MEKSLFEQMGGTYTQVGDYLIPNLRLPEQQGQPIGVWGQRHARYLKQHHKIIYMNLLTSGKLNDYLVDIENQAVNVESTVLEPITVSKFLDTLSETDWKILTMRMDDVTLEKIAEASLSSSIFS